jgi:hypothetical protein
MEPCFAGAAISADRYPHPVPRRGRHKSYGTGERIMDG